MKKEEQTLMKSLGSLMEKEAQEQLPVVEEPMAVEQPLAVEEPLGDNDIEDDSPLGEISASVKVIRHSLRKAELGDRSAVQRIESELDAIERAQKRASKFSLL